jgi:hypothetical protein
MARVSRILLTGMAVSTFLLSGMGHPADVRAPDAVFVTDVAQAVPSGGGFGFTWGAGTLAMADGQKHRFSVQGIGARGNAAGIRDLEVYGDVYHLQKAEDFAGTYKRSPADAPAGVDRKAVVLKNEHGVVVAFIPKIETQTAPDLAVTPSESGVKVTLTVSTLGRPLFGHW